MHSKLYVFFFQAEDGIRDGHVTGVQTCALPICGRAASSTNPIAITSPRKGCRTRVHGPPPKRSLSQNRRSEERRVGKECRSRLSKDYQKKIELIFYRLNI